MAKAKTTEGTAESEPISNKRKSSTPRFKVAQVVDRPVSETAKEGDVASLHSHPAHHRKSSILLRKSSIVDLQVQQDIKDMQEAQSAATGGTIVALVISVTISYHA
jgi:hypothetical protein